MKRFLLLILAVAGLFCLVSTKANAGVAVAVAPAYCGEYHHRLAGPTDYGGQRRVRGWSGGGVPADDCGGAAARWRRLLRRSGLPGLELLGLMLWAVFVSTRWPAVVGADCDQFARVALSTPRT